MQQWPYWEKGNIKEQKSNMKSLLFYSHSPHSSTTEIKHCSSTTLQTLQHVTQAIIFYRRTDQQRAHMKSRNITHQPSFLFPFYFRLFTFFHFYFFFLFFLFFSFFFLYLRLQSFPMDFTFHSRNCRNGTIFFSFTNIIYMIDTCANIQVIENYCILYTCTSSTQRIPLNCHPNVHTPLTTTKQRYLCYSLNKIFLSAISSTARRGCPYF